MGSANKINLIISVWAETVARRSHATALLSSTGKGLRTFAEIERDSLRFTSSLSVFRPGGIVALQIANSPDWPALLLAIIRAGLIPLPLGTHFEKNERDIALKTCQAAGIIEIAEGGGVEFRPLSGSGTPDCDLLKLTYGTGAEPRAIRFRSEQLIADCNAICDTMRITETDINFGGIPFSHSYGLSSLILPLICRGVPLVACENRMPRGILTDLTRTQATIFPGMPIFYQAFSEMENLPKLPCLRLCISAGAPLPRSVADKFTRKFGLKIHSFYGASECGGVSYDASDALDYQNAALGTSMLNVEIQFLESSCIEIRGPAVGDGYFPVADVKQLHEGRFIPFDLVERTERGMIYTGTLSEVINIAGRKLNPLEVEAVLKQLPDVEEVVVFGIPSLLRNEEPVACVVGTISQSDLIHQAQARLSSWQMPRDFWRVEAIPDHGSPLNRRSLAHYYLHTEGRHLQKMTID